ncbi:MAG TPA: hypothetical protein VM555_02995 [Tahibacter sp.]|nr:hypothetical protein [Tahibacter sp.]
MANEQETARYWRSDRGQDAFERLLDEHYAALFAGRPVTVDERVFGEILRVDDFPSNRYVTLITRGLSLFILDRGGSVTDGIRIELAWTVDRHAPIETLCDVIEWLVDPILESRAPPDINAISARIDDVHAKGVIETRNVLFVTEQWISPSAAQIDNYFPMYIVEAVALNDPEAAIARDDIDAFYRLARERRFAATSVVRTTPFGA